MLAWLTGVWHADLAGTTARLWDLLGVADPYVAAQLDRAVAKHNVYQSARPKYFNKHLGNVTSRGDMRWVAARMRLAVQTALPHTSRQAVQPPSPIHARLLSRRRLVATIPDVYAKIQAVRRKIGCESPAAPALPGERAAVAESCPRTSTCQPPLLCCQPPSRRPSPPNHAVPPVRLTDPAVGREASPW